MAEEEAKKIAELRDQERTEQEIRQQKITDITDRFVTPVSYTHLITGITGLAGQYGCCNWTTLHAQRG